MGHFTALNILLFVGYHSTRQLRICWCLSYNWDMGFRLERGICTTASRLFFQISDQFKVNFKVLWKETLQRFSRETKWVSIRQVNFFLWSFITPVVQEPSSCLTQHLFLTARSLEWKICWILSTQIPVSVIADLQRIRSYSDLNVYVDSQSPRLLTIHAMFA